MEQQFLQVWRDGELWFEFPAGNEDNVRLDLMRKGVDRVCEIKPKVADIEVLKESIKSQVNEINLNDMDKPKVTRTRKPKAEEATNS